MSGLVAWVAIAALWAPVARSDEAAAPGGAPTSARPDLGKLPANAWVEITPAHKPEAAFCSMWYLPTSDEFFFGGKKRPNSRLAL